MMAIGRTYGWRSSTSATSSASATPHLTRSRTTAASDTAGASHPRGIDERHPFLGRWYLCSRWCFEKLASLSFAARCPSARQVDLVFKVNQPQDDRGKTSRSERTDE